ncbi:hypothetical protein B7494_g5231 [Chlorociboria aeruginascens]|nr:hypothetical protein B7494_g5231 [Chlorociboria aeruginascens]
MRTLILPVAILAQSVYASPVLEDRDNNCQTGYTVCAPAGATSTTTPQIGDASFPDLFHDIVQSSLPSSKRSLSSRDTASLCCVSSLACLAMSSLSIPFCYDKFTTNFFLPDGSYGTIVGGAYTSSRGDKANLESGNYTLADGTTGNIYQDDASAKPDTATLPIPAQFTGSGVGSAIPASALGGEVTLTLVTTLPATTIQGSTRPATTIPQSVVSTANSVATIPATTLPGTTVPATTIGAETTTITTTEAASSTAAAATTKKKNAAGRRRVDMWLELAGNYGNIYILADFHLGDRYHSKPFTNIIIALGFIFGIIHILLTSTFPELLQSTTGFSDCALLIVTVSSLNGIHPRLGTEKMILQKFRPDIVIDGEERWDEDIWEELTIEDKNQIKLTANCARCASLNVDLETGRQAKGEVGQVLKN